MCTLVSIFCALLFTIFCALLITDYTKERSAELKALYKLKDSKREIVAYLIIYKRSGSSEEYICVPSPNSNEEINSRIRKAKE